MPPDADKLRQRNVQTATIKAIGGNDSRGGSATVRVAKAKSLRGHEVAIDGIIYDISDFDHPGGDSIGIFGGNDVTVPYKMIHPYHTAKHLEKMTKVGIIQDYRAEYEFDTEFEREIKREVFKVVRRGREFGTPGWYFRAACYILLFFILQYVWVTTQSTTFALAVVYGVSQALIGLNVQHDANHGAASRRPWINDVLGLGADFIGGSKWLWMQQHWTHHSYTNHAAMDPDSFAAEPMLLFNDYPPENPKRIPIHHFQAFYYLFVLGGYWLSAVFNPQVLDLRQRGALSVGMSMESDYTKRNRKFAAGLRLLYIATNVIAPFYHDGKFGFSWQTLAHVMVMGVASSLTLSILFALSHNFENVDRDPTATARTTGAPVCWFKSQVETSSTYGSFISGYLTGGLNFQVEHHLFPRMSSSWYPYIAPKVREICAKHGVKYAYYPWLHQNLISTVKYLHQAGTGSNWLEGNPYLGEN